MLYRTLGWAALGLFAVANIPFWLRMANVITVSGKGYPWANLVFIIFGTLTIIVSIAFFFRWLLHLTQTWGPVPRWSLTCLASTALLAGESFCFLILCVGINFVGN